MKEKKIETVNELVDALKAYLATKGESMGYFVIYADRSGHISRGIQGFSGSPFNDYSIPNKVLCSFSDVTDLKTTTVTKLVNVQEK